MAGTWDELRRDVTGQPTIDRCADRYGVNACGHHEMANAFMNRVRSGGERGMPESFAAYHARTGKGDPQRGWWGLPRVPERCLWAVTGVCPGAPICTAKHEVVSDVERRAA